ncbi:MAG: hypothetical protein ACI9MC_000588 [Kiritimatiellia bacterium]|jgi:hypothetical protein
MTRLLIATLALSLPMPALALSCLDRGVTSSLPERDAEQVPSNAIISLQTLGSPIDVHLQAVGAQDPIDAALSREDQGSGQLIVLDPTLDLPAGQYEVVVNWENDETWQENVQFTVVDAQDDHAPAAPTVLSTDHRVRNDVWGRWESFRVELSDADEPVRFELELADNPEFTDSNFRAAFYSDFSLWDSPCDSDPLAASRAKNTWIRVRAIDIAGNSSAKQDVEPMGGCSSLAAPIGGGSVLILALGLLGVRRRRSSTLAR